MVIACISFLKPVQAATLVFGGTGIFRPRQKHGFLQAGQGTTERGYVGRRTTLRQSKHTQLALLIVRPVWRTILPFSGGLAGPPARGTDGEGVQRLAVFGQFNVAGSDLETRTLILHQEAVLPPMDLNMRIVPLSQATNELRIDARNHQVSIAPRLFESKAKSPVRRRQFPHPCDGAVPTTEQRRKVAEYFVGAIRHLESG